MVFSAAANGPGTRARRTKKGRLGHRRFLVVELAIGCSRQGLGFGNTSAVPRYVLADETGKMRRSERANRAGGHAR